MRLHFLRNATLIIETGLERVLVDPMLGPQGGWPPLAFVRHAPRRNPTVALPPNARAALDDVTDGLITHCRWGHFDHLDRAGSELLSARKIPVYCNYLDASFLRRRGIRTVALTPHQPHAFLNGTIRAYPTEHGYGLVGKLMGPGLGYCIQLPNEPSLYISGDTVLTPVVKQVLADCRPDISILASGAASLDIGKPILMPLSEQLEFIRLASGQVVATHMEAINHCPVTRAVFRDAVAQAGLSEKVRVPYDGEVLRF